MTEKTLNSTRVSVARKSMFEFEKNREKNLFSLQKNVIFSKKKKDKERQTMKLK